MASETQRFLAKLSGNLKTHKALAVAVAATLLVLIAFIDYITGVDFSFSIFYLIPIMLVAWYVGLRAGFLASIAGAVLWFVVDSILGGHLYLNPAAGYWNSLVRFGFFIIVTVILSRLRRSLETIRSHSEDLVVAYTDLDHVRKEQLVMKDQILSHVSHELRTPLAAVHQFISILVDGLAGPLKGEQKDYLRIALKNVIQLNKMIDDILESSRIDADKVRFQPEPVRLQEILDELVATLRSLASEKRISLDVAAALDLPSVYADPDRVRQVLLNLLDNALKFTPEKGAINVQTAVFKGDPGFICVSVSDTGPGISPEGQEGLFQRLHQGEEVNSSSRKGLGLGLYISKEIVSRHKGKIWVVSQPGRGSTFSFTLPIYSPGPKGAAARKEGGASWEAKS